MAKKKKATKKGLNDSPVTKQAASKKKAPAKKKAPTKKKELVKEKTKTLESVAYKRIALEHVLPDDLATIFSNNFVVQNDGPEFYFLFFHTQPPLIIGGAEHTAEKLEALDSIKTECVARVVISADRVPSIIRALQDNYEKYKLKESSGINEIDLS
ncbi:hypothetical protein [Gimesia panareensis]|uniref:hypothetical protein n=1 Tax=Gimesia panareensis TaxID=2527978 RepID=UPI00119F3CFE|nr:hypothetical protein [Gimesia panareensis]